MESQCAFNRWADIFWWHAFSSALHGLDRAARMVPIRLTGLAEVHKSKLFLQLCILPCASSSLGLSSPTSLCHAGRKSDRSNSGAAKHYIRQQRLARKNLGIVAIFMSGGVKRLTSNILRICEWYIRIIFL